MRIVLLVAAEVGAVVLCDRLADVPWLRVDWRDPVSWLGATPPGDALAGIVLAVVSLLSWWLVVTTCGHLVAHLTGSAAAVRATAALVAPVVRRVVAGSVIGLTLVGPAHASVGPPVPPHAVEQPDGKERRSGAGDRPASAARPDVVAGVHVVRPGDSLWSIAARVTGGRGTARYWLALLDANRTRLRSGDPDLVYPGERLVLPDPHVR